MSHEANTENPTRDLESRAKKEVQLEQTRPGLLFRPDVDIVELAEEYLITADLPGVDEQHVKVRLEEGVLSIEAGLAVEPNPDWTPAYEEYRIGGFQREFALSDKIDAEKINASMRDGVLELHLPKMTKHRPRAIAVKAG